MEIEESWSSPFRCQNWFWSKCDQWVWFASSTCQRCLDEGKYGQPEIPWQDRMRPEWWETNRRYGDANKWWERRGIDPSRFGYSAETGIERIRRYLVMRGAYPVEGSPSPSLSLSGKESEVVKESGVMKKPAAAGVKKSTRVRKPGEVISGGVQKSVGAKKGGKKDEKTEKGFGLAIKDLLH